MIKRTIEVSGPDTRLSMRLGQIHVERDGKQIGQVPAEDVGLLIVDSPSTIYTHSTLVELINQGALVLLCGPDHLPAAFVTPCAANSLQTERLALQINAKLPCKKRLWRQIVRAKIQNQARNLPRDSGIPPRLLALARRVRSGDPENIEAQAARLYWPVWLPSVPEFLRRRDGEWPNALLNYGYAILRAAIARALAGAGLHPSISLQHHSRYDTFCLADDLMEPLRPLVDRAVRQLFLNGHEEINKETKTAILSLLLEPVFFGRVKGPLFVELERTAASLVRCYAGETDRLDIPLLPW